MKKATKDPVARTIVDHSDNPSNTRIVNAQACPCDCDHCKTLTFTILRSDGKKEFWKLLCLSFFRLNDGVWQIDGIASIDAQYHGQTYIPIFFPSRAEIRYDPSSRTGSVLSLEPIKIELT